MSPEFKDGAIIVIDPQGHVQDKSYVIANIQGEILLRQIHIQDDEISLHALNEPTPGTRLNNLDAVEGVVIQQAGKRRKDRKYYRPEGLT